MTTQRKKLDAGADRLIRHAQLGDTADVALRSLSQAANHGKLWFAAAGAVALTGPRGRDAAIGGLVSLGAASAMANLILKPLVGGKRPDPQTLSSARRLKGQPLSGAFPSGHSASAAAFATGASLSWPVLTPVLAPLAGLVGYSRIHTGAH